jgi:hypothetical protein
LRLFQEQGKGRIKENDGGGEFNYDIRTFVNVSMYPQCNNNITKKRKRTSKSPPSRAHFLREECPI